LKRVILASVIVFSFFLAGCTSTTKSSDPADIEKVSTVEASAITTSGTPTAEVPDSLPETKALLSSLKSDSALSDIMSAFQGTSSSTGGKSLSSGKSKALGALSSTLGLLSGKSISAKDLSSAVGNQIEAVESDWAAFPSKKSMSESIDLSGNALSDYFKLTTATADYSLSVTTSDSKDFDVDEYSNFKSGSVNGSLKLVVTGTDLLYGNTSTSSLKDFVFKLNAGGSGSLGSSVVDNDRELADLSAKYAVSGVLAFSAYNSDAGLGGKVVITIDVSDSLSVAHPMEASSSTYYPDVTITLKVYDDDNNLKCHEEWTDINAFMSAIK
jgi:hypothetical protein